MNKFLGRIGLKDKPLPHHEEIFGFDAVVGSSFPKMKYWFNVNNSFIRLIAVYAYLP
jgi:hypothetical protein